MITGTSTLTSSNRTYGGSASSVSLGRCIRARGFPLCANLGFLLDVASSKNKLLPESRIICQGEMVYIFLLVLYFITLEFETY